MIFFCSAKDEDGKENGCQKFWSAFPTNRMVTKAPRRLCPDCRR